MLVRIARHSRIGNPEGCAALLMLLSASRLLRNELHRVLTGLGLSQIRFAALVSLYASDPDPCTPADLAYHVQVSRATMADILDEMCRRGWITRKRVRTDRRSRHICLTDDGRTLFEHAVQPFLSAVSRCAEVLDVEEREAVGRASSQIHSYFQPNAS